MDLLLEREDGFFAFECKQTEHVGPVDFRHLRDLASILDKPLLLGLVVSNDRTLGRLQSTGAPLWNVTAAGLLG